MVVLQEDKGDWPKQHFAFTVNEADINRAASMLREKGVTVLDLSAKMLKLEPSQLQNLFMPGGHYSPAMKRLVAEQIAAFLHERGIRSPSEQSRTVP